MVEATTAGTIVVGLIYTLFAAVLYGSWIIPLRGYNFRDSMFAQWIVMTGALLAGLLILLLDGNHRFYAVPAIGGVMYSVAIILLMKCMGELSLGPAYLIADLVIMLGNYATGYFGLFWTMPRPPSMKWLSFIGLGIIGTAAVLIAMVEKKKDVVMPVDYQSKGGPNNPPSPGPVVIDADDRLLVRFRRPIWVFLAIVMGALFSQCVTPTTAYVDAAIRNKWTIMDVPLSYIPFLFSFNVGAFVTSTVIFIAYAAAKRNRPYVSGELVLPALVAGMVLNGGLLFWFLSVEKLTQGITGSITAVLPGCVASIWSVFYYREVKPGRSYVALAGAIVLALAGAVAIGLAK